MARILLEIGADATQAEQSLQKMAGDFNKLSGVSKKMRDDVKKGFDDVADSAKKANEEFKSPSVPNGLKKQLSAIQQLKAEIKAYESAALKAGEGTAEFARNIALAGSKKAELKDLKDAISALDPDSVTKSFLNLSSSIAGGFAVAQGAIALTGSKSEELEKALLKVQSAQAILAGLQQLANTQDEIGKVRVIALNKLQSLELKKDKRADSGTDFTHRRTVR